MYQTLEQVIRQYVSLSGASGTEGWVPVVCKVCNDHGRKGPRAGFKFDKNAVGYHCFNCGHKAAFDPNKTSREGRSSVSPKMVEVLDAFDIPRDEWRAVLFQHLKDQHAGLTTTDEPSPAKTLEPKELLMPAHFYRLDEAKKNDKWAIVAREYLQHIRQIDPTSYPFYLSRKTGDMMLDKKWYKRLIIPIYKDDKLIFYIGRALDDNPKRYESPRISKSKVLYGFDQLFKNTDRPLYVVEGFFDALLIDGVALLGNEISEEQIQWLNRSPRKKVYIPDMFGSGRAIAFEAVENGWSVSIPEIPGCKDINDAVIKYGKMYVQKSIVDNVADGFAAKVRLNMLIK